MQTLDECWNAVWQFYKDHGRHDLPWRTCDKDGVFDPYAILVSEIMLQQTQVMRVIPKYKLFLEQFPTVHSLAQAELADVLTLWSGLGYNRRAKFLLQAAQSVVKQYGGVIPSTAGELVRLPGVGVNTAGAIVAYGFNRPVTYVETNIRTVCMHHCFSDQDGVTDREILELLLILIDRVELEGRTVREWYWALMDYGSHLKQTQGNNISRSKGYVKQSTFQGSQRQIRGQVVKILTKQSQKKESISKQITDDRLEIVLSDLQREGIISLSEGRYHLGTVAP